MYTTSNWTEDFPIRVGLVVEGYYKIIVCRPAFLVTSVLQLDSSGCNDIFASTRVCSDKCIYVVGYATFH